MPLQPIHLSPLRWTAVVCAGLGCLLALLVQFLPFAGLSANFGGATAGADAYLWQAEFTATFAGDSSSESRSWYDGDFDGEDGSGQVRFAAPLLTAALVLSALATLLLVVRPRPGAGLALLCALLTGVGVLLFSLGVAGLFDDEQRWSVGFYLGIAAAALLAGAGTLGLVREPPAEPLPPGAPDPNEPGGPAP